MATRALIGMIETDAAGNQVLTSTYNHYDGYPDSLGVALNRHYDEPQSAKRISNQGYISFLDPDSGAIDAKNKDKAGKDSLPDDFEEAMKEIHSIADSMGADYVYIYAFDDADWVSAENDIKDIINKFESTSIYDQFDDYSSYEDDPDNPLGIPGDYDDLSLEENKSKCIVKAQTALKDKPELGKYMSSLTNDIRLNGDDAYADYESDDWVEDYEEYIADKSSLEEQLKRQFQVRAGIIK